MIRPILLCAVTAILAAGASAYASTSHIFGKGGQTYQFSSVCQRVTIPRPGISDHEALNLLGQQVTCLAKREKKIRNCYRRVVVEGRFDHGDGKPGDWTGVDGLHDCGMK